MINYTEVWRNDASIDKEIFEKYMPMIMNVSNQTKELNRLQRTIDMLHMFAKTRKQQHKTWNDWMINTPTPKGGDLND